MSLVARRIFPVCISNNFNKPAHFHESAKKFPPELKIKSFLRENDRGKASNQMKKRLQGIKQSYYFYTNRSNVIN